MIAISALQHWHRPVFLTLSAAIIALALAAGGSLAVSGLVLVIWGIAVAVLGLPHGAYDLRVARAMGLARSDTGLVKVAAGYLAIAVAFALLWIAAPGVWLIAFLAISAVHFSEDWADELPRWGRVGAGAAIIGMPAVAHRVEVERIFSLLAPGPVAPALASGLAPIAIAALVSITVAILAGKPRRWLAGAELLAIVGLALALPPLLFFIAYFCGMHSARQMLATASRLGAGTLGAAIRMAAPLTAITLAGVAILMPFLGSTSDERILRAAFVGLACLTAPHMALNLWVERRPDQAGTLPGVPAAA